MVAACAGGHVASMDPVSSRRAVTITTTACGHSSHTVGTGIVIESGVVLTAAHVVIGSTNLVIDNGLPAVLTRLDPARDLASLAVTTADFAPVEYGDLSHGQTVAVATAPHSEPVDLVVDSHATLSIDDVRGKLRHDRGGYALSGRIAPGDSGAGLFANNRLAGLVFAVASDAEAASYATDASEIVSFLATPDTERFRCDPERSRVVTRSTPLGDEVIAD